MAVQFLDLPLRGSRQRPFGESPREERELGTLEKQKFLRPVLQPQ